MAKILMVGCGTIGSELANGLAGAGHDVIGLRRNPPAGRAGKFSFFTADIAQAIDLQQLPTDFEHVFFIVSGGRHDANSYEAIYKSGVDNLLNHFGRAGCNPPWFFVSSTSVYGQTQGEWVDEDSETYPKSANSQKILVAECQLLAEYPASTIVRFSGIYGPGRTHLLKMAQTSPEIQRDPPYYTNRVHQEDCVSVLAFLLKKRLEGVKLEQRYLVSDDDPAPMWEVVSWLAEAQSLPSPKPLDYTTKTECDMNKRCSNNRIKALGYRFLHPDFKSGYAGLLKLI